MRPYLALYGTATATAVALMFFEFQNFRARKFWRSTKRIYHHRESSR